MAASTGLEFMSLPSDPLLHILTFLDYNDLVSCCQVCQRLHQLASHDFHWKHLCHKHWALTECPEGISWKEHFMNWFKEYGKYINCYKKIKKAWDQIETFMQENCPTIYESIEAGLSEGQIDAIENKIHQTLPTDVRCSYRIHNGQRLGMSSGLIGSMAISSHYRTEVFLDLYTSSNNYQDNGELQCCLPLTFCMRTHVSQLIALSDDGGYDKGQIFYPCPDNLGSHSEVEHLDNFLSSSSFTDWFTLYGQQLQEKFFPILVGQVFRFYREPSCVEVTNHIKVTVATCFMPELSSVNPPHYFFTYQIMMHMPEDSPKGESCQLETRHWIITGEDGHEEMVDGPGVVGEYPIMKPGATFSWTSCTTFSTTYGNMRGHFTMRNLSTGATVDVVCPVFHMKCLPYQTSAQRKEKAMEIKKNN